MVCETWANIASCSPQANMYLGSSFSCHRKHVSWTLEKASHKCPPGVARTPAGRTCVEDHRWVKTSPCAKSDCPGFSRPVDCCVLSLSHNLPSSVDGTTLAGDKTTTVTVIHYLIELTAVCCCSLPPETRPHTAAKPILWQSLGPIGTIMRSHCGL